MRVVAAELLSYEWPLAAAFANARQEWQTRRGLLLVLRDEEGRIGLGEAAPLPGFSPDELDDADAALRALEKGQLPLEIDECLPVPPQIVRLLGALPLPPSARCALETALLDLAGRRALVPVSCLLRGRFVEEEVPLQGLVGPGSAEERLAAARAAFDAGLQTLKLKVGLPGRLEEEQQLARSLRAELGPELRLRLDANQAWSADEASAALAGFAPAAPEHVEEPVEDPVAAGAAVLGQLPLPVALDECLAEPLGHVLAESGACAHLVLKPMTLGGPLRCLIVARRARARGQGVTISHLLEGPVGMALGAELALALGPEGGAAGLAPHPGLAAWEGIPVPQLEGARVRPRSLPGLGLDPERVQAAIAGTD